MYVFSSSIAHQGYFYNRLKTITYSKDGYHYNPTRIEWGENDYLENQTRYIEVTNTYGQTAYHHFNNMIKFAGDFNGDGLTDVLVYSEGNTALPDVEYRAKIYINEGNTTHVGGHHNNDGDLYFRNPNQSIQLPHEADWIYVTDFNGDGLDDFLCSSRESGSGWRDKVYLDAYITHLDNEEVTFQHKTMPENSYSIRKRLSETILVGDFLGEGKSQFFMQAYSNSKDNQSSEYGYLFRYINGSFESHEFSDGIVGAEKFITSDFNGDGMTEIIYSSEDTPNCKMVHFVHRYIWGIVPTLSIETIQDFGMGLTHWHKMFCGDFNGDGKTDLLTFASGGSAGDGLWRINLFKGDRLDFPSYNLTDLMGIGDPGNHGFSLNGGTDTYKFVEVADANGDGKSDIIVRLDNGNFRILYAPFRLEQSGDGYTACPADIQEFSVGQQTVSKKTICLGNFLGNETISMFWSTTAIMPTANWHGQW